MSISQQIKDCKLCPLSAKLDLGFKPQPGNGIKTAKILVLYDLLSRDDYLTQTCLAGNNGLIFNKILDKIQLSREELYITPLVKCYSETSPSKDCVKTCSGWLKKQIEGLSPKAIVTFGAVSSKQFSQKTLKELYSQTLIKNGRLIIPMPSLFNLVNVGQNMFNYHVDRLRKVKEWVSQQAINMEKVEKK